jgi:hypothetical protein
MIGRLPEDYKLVRLGVRGSGWGRPRFGKRNRKRTTLFWEADDGEVSMVGSGNGPGQAQAQPDALLGPALVAAIKPVKNAGKIAWRNTDPGVRYGYHPVFVFSLQGNGYRAS